MHIFSDISDKSFLVVVSVSIKDRLNVSGK